MNSLMKDFLKAVKHQQPSQVPVAIFNVAPFTTSFTGTDINRYYRDPDLKMATQLKLSEMLPEFIMIPSVWADFGPAVECSAFGSEVLWMENSPPFVKRVIHSYQEIDRIRPINPESDGLMPLALEHYRYMWDHIDPSRSKEKGCLEGVAVSMGPVETAGLLIDYQNFFLGIYDAPDLIKRLLDVVTESILLWIQAQEKVNGKLKQLVLIDHMPAQISAPAFEEFCFPYLKRIFDQYSYAVRIYHNEGNVSHILERIADMRVDLFHFGIDIKIAKKVIGNRVALMGNIHPVNFLLDKGPDEIKEECLKCLQEGATGGGFILSSGGGLAPQTPKENIEAMLEAVKFWKKSKTSSGL
jgi:uroporphyrinogen decarboxylase